MAHIIAGFIAQTELLRKGTEELKTAHIIELGQGFSLVPVTDELHDEVWQQNKNIDNPFEEFWKLSPDIARLGIQMSKRGAIAYVETDYFGGVGEQAAILWEYGSIAVGPLKDDIGPINEVLQRMGVNNIKDHDEFETLGLYRYRNNVDWVEQP